MSKLANLVCMVTGGASGLGRATVENFVRNGSKVVVCDLANSQGHSLAKELGEANCVFHPTDGIDYQLDSIIIFKYLFAIEIFLL